MVIHQVHLYQAVFPLVELLVVSKLLPRRRELAKQPKALQLMWPGLLQIKVRTGHKRNSHKLTKRSHVNGYEEEVI